MSARRISHSLLGMSAASLLISPPLAAGAETICTELIRGADGSIPIEDRESARQVQARIKPDLIGEGDQLAGEGKLAEAVEAYAGAFGGYWYVGFYSGAERCLPMEFYQKAADKLRVVASELAEQRTTKGYLLDESHEYGGDFQRGALGLYLTSNQYDSFVREAFAYADAEFLERDIDGHLIGMVRARLNELEEYRNAASKRVGYVDDRAPLLDEELAAFSKLAGFDEKLAARFASRYPEITDHWLAEESRHFDGFDKTDGAIPKGMLHGQATESLEAGIRRLAEHPQQVARLKARADVRGETLMKKGRETTRGDWQLLSDHYAFARDYFEIAGNQEQYAKADRLSEERQESVAKKMEASIRTDVEKMQKSEEEQSAFQDETDEMAAEFGFDLDE